MAGLTVHVWSSRVFWGRWAPREDFARDEVAKVFLQEPEVRQAAANLPPPSSFVRIFFYIQLRDTDLYGLPSAQYRAVVEEYTRDYISRCLENGCNNAFTDGRA